MAESKAKARAIRMSPQKVRLVADLIRGKKVSDILPKRDAAPAPAADAADAPAEA